ncbi:MAG TPA: hypothetical protein VJ810_23745 [Blastocatellia bacterium]|nr:hypothetical protein [Blastocatellia bacterium]
MALEAVNPYRTVLDFSASAALPPEADAALINTGGGAVTITLPTPQPRAGSVQPGAVRLMKTTGDGNAVTIAAPAGASLVGRSSLTTQWDNVECVPTVDGRWLVF